MSDLIEGFLGKSVDGKKSRLPAKLDYIQSATGLFLGLFMWGHMFFVSTILISKDFMYTLTKFMEGSMFFDEPKPGLVSLAVGTIFIIFIIHAAMGLRKLPANFRQWQIYRTHMKMMKHDETSMWFIQAVTGFSMFFLGSAHLFLMLTQPGTIGPYGSGDRMLTLWPFYLMLLFAVELHGSIGLYRLCIKWGWFEGEDAKKTRKTLKKVKWIITVFFLVLGLATLLAYLKIGMDHSDRAGERYHPTTQIEKNYNVNTEVKA
ncbi:fumarate reductase cytochrome b subunit [Sulfurimonas sp.]|uniref:fumarate reductase cytochrome b subunit n=1 Tax=Sulfurimonas sp. TaxID=2022749 RepID=UPI002AB14377|nr:fumarate reductase cytochrome b subunit [Sulfurimonas sp.]